MELSSQNKKPRKAGLLSENTQEQALAVSS